MSTRTAVNPSFLYAAFQYLLISLMSVCLTLTVLNMASRFSTSRLNAVIIAVSFFVSLESLISSHYARQMKEFSREFLFFRISEIIVLVIILKIASYTGVGLTVLLSEASQWGNTFFETFFSVDFFLLFLQAIVSWVVAWLLSKQLAKLNENTEELDLERQGNVRSNRMQGRQELMAVIFALGGFMLLATAFINIKSPHLPDRYVSISLNVIYMVCYFILGMALLAQTQLSLLRAQWYIDQVPLQPTISRRWYTTSFIILGIIALLVILLPTSYSMGFLGVLQTIIFVIVGIFTFLQLMLLTPFLSFLNWLSNLLGMGGSQNPMPVETEHAPLPTAETQATIPWLESLKSISFWIIFTLVIVLAAVYYIRQRRDLMSAIGGLSLVKFVSQFWRWLKGVFSSTRIKILQTVKAGTERLRIMFAQAAAAPGPISFLLEKLPPRQQILIIYAQWTVFCGQQGFPRQPYQTPFEFADYLHKQSPQTIDLANSITTRFIEARYTRHPISMPSVYELRQTFQLFQQKITEIADNDHQTEKT